MMRILIVVFGVFMVVGAGVWAESSAVDTNKVLLGGSSSIAKQEAACMASVPKTPVSFKGLLDDPLCCTMLNDSAGRQSCLQRSVDRINAIHVFLWNIYSSYREGNLAATIAKHSRGQVCAQWSRRIDEKIPMSGDPAEVNQLKVKEYLKLFPNYLSCLGYRDSSRDQGYID